MNADELLLHYERVADAPDAVPRLRRFVLDLAILGRLTKQQTDGLPSRATSQPHLHAHAAAPEGWRPVRLREALIELQTGPFGSALHQSDYAVGGTPVVNPASIQPPKIVPIASMAVGPETLKRLSNFRLRAGDVVMARRGEMGRCALVTNSEAGWLCGTGSLVLRPKGDLQANYLVLLLGTPKARDYLSTSAVGTTMQNLNQRVLLDLSFWLPPLAEQHRIVAKVDDLTALLDQLEHALSQVRELKRRLLEALLHRTLEPDKRPVAWPN